MPSPPSLLSGRMSVCLFVSALSVCVFVGKVISWGGGGGHAYVEGTKSKLIVPSGYAQTDRSN